MTASAHPWQDTSKSPEERARALVAAMTLDRRSISSNGQMETIDIYAPPDPETNQFEVVRQVGAIDELGIPRMRITNGPVGVGMGDGPDSPPATSLPMTIGLAAGFDPEMAADYGDIIGSETATLGQHVLEGPALGLHRIPGGGRHFEYFSEDPYLSGVMGIEVTNAIQAHDIIAMAKHYVLNDQENERFRANVEIDEHVLRELYLLPFEMLVKETELASIMTAYNRVRGTYATEHRYLVTDVLRGEWGFEGYVQSDFWSTRSAAPSIHAGLDLEMPDGKWLNEETVKAALHDTSLEIEAVDRALARRFTQMFKFGHFESTYDPGTIEAEAHGARSRKMGGQMAVLLKNEGDMLPLDPTSGSVLIVGQQEYAGQACLGGGGSSRVVPLYTVDPLDGMRNVVADLGGSAEVELRVVADDLSDLDDAVAAAGSADTVVVLKDSNPVVVPWIDQVPAVMEAWNQGSEDGHVVADLLIGAVNPSGKLPTTYPRTADEHPTAGRPERYPGTDEGDGYPVMHYSEGLAMGYRWFQSEGVEPRFPFGYGLSYTTFTVDDLSVDAGANPGAGSVTVRATVTNTGQRSGAEVVQVYLQLPASTGQPPRRLVAFRKVHLDSGQSETVEIVLDPDASSHPLSVWSIADHSFVVPEGAFDVHVGTSSASTEVAGNFTVEAR